jgi:valyl-tRNA synthetase
VNASLEGYHYNEAASAIYQFLWPEFCDWYLEIVKPRLAGEGEDGAAARAAALRVLIRTLALAHPVMPFVTEEISEVLPGTREPLSQGPYPVADEALRDEGAESDMACLIEIISAVRTIRGEMNVKPGLEIAVVLLGLPEEQAALVQEHVETVRRLGRIGELVLNADTAPAKAAASPLTTGELYIPMEGIIDFRSEVARLEKEKGKLEKEIARYEKKLSRKDFIEKAPAEVVAKDRGILAESKERLAYLTGGLDRVLSWIGE